jgi:hypothetical protein
MHQLAQIPGNLFRSAVPGHDPQKRRRECMPAIPLDHDDPMPGRQEAAEFVSDDLSSNSATQYYDGLCVCHDVLLSCR